MLCTSVVQGQTDPEQTGMHFFEILKKISTSTKQEYLSNFMSFEGVSKVRGETQNDNYNRTPLTKEDWLEKHQKSYNQIKRVGGKAGVNWQQIEFLDFTYEEISRDGATGLKTEVYFKYKDKTFSIKVVYVFINNEYKLGVAKTLYNTSDK